mmetsp:Transcript_34106/g.70959  ORF Transcript_34106/g.70959 Transcript_34106/m.70959 type:complete len:404 (-) Transcript_34106:1528-2739(-)
MIQELQQGSNGSGNRNLIFPLKLSPHASESFVSAGCGADVIHDIHVNVIQIDVTLFHSGGIVIHNSPKDMTSFSGANFDGGTNGHLIQRPNGMRLRTFHNLHVTHGGQFHSKVGKCVGGAVHDQNFQNNIIVMDCHERFGIDRIGKTTQLVNMGKLRTQSARTVVSSGTSEIGTIVQIQISSRRSHGLELTEVDQVISLGCHFIFLIAAFSCGLLEFPLLDNLQEFRKTLASFLQEDLLQMHLGGRIQESTATECNTFLTISQTGALSGNSHFSHFDNSAHGQDSCGSHGLDLGRIHSRRVTSAKTELSKAGGHSFSQENITRNQHATKRGSFVGRSRSLGLAVDGLGGVSAIGQHDILRHHFRTGVGFSSLISGLFFLCLHNVRRFSGLFSNCIKGFSDTFS